MPTSGMRGMRANLFKFRDLVYLGLYVTSQSICVSVNMYWFWSGPVSGWILKGILKGIARPSMVFTFTGSSEATCHLE